MIALIGFQLMSGLAFAKNIKCQDYATTEKKLNLESEKLGKSLIQINQQLTSMKTEVDNYNKNCQSASSTSTTSSAKCNPGKQNMMMSQLPIISGQKNKTESDIVNLKTKASAEHENFINCKKAMAIRK